MAEAEKLIKEEKAKRKELSRVRVFWLLVVSSIVLAGVITIQIMLLIQAN